jgi:hypothetical protein
LRRGSLGHRVREKGRVGLPDGKGTGAIGDDGEEAGGEEGEKDKGPGKRAPDLLGIVHDI